MQLVPMKWLFNDFSFLPMGKKNRWTYSLRSRIIVSIMLLGNQYCAGYFFLYLRNSDNPYSCCTNNKNPEKDIEMQAEVRKCKVGSHWLLSLSLIQMSNCSFMNPQTETEQVLLSSSLIFLSTARIKSMYQSARPLFLTSVTAGIESECHHCLVLCLTIVVSFALWSSGKLYSLDHKPIITMYRYLGYGFLLWILCIFFNSQFYALCIWTKTHLLITLFI